ncbi:hypothetical protein DWF00_25615 [Bosea caraganae]|uniref:Uncharacterized protein n=2 Tax=Bosea caraganae TaxID=2763117 RepID=A0A370LA90_9HYPH|nr:hypothetical protein DWF00_25615 [Bosea caraganae]RDJ28235.1 hypothetical protein DWE98_06540 [Bosea caraganae]
MMAGVLLAALDGGAMQAGAQQPEAESWTVEKCNRYKKAWTDALGRFGRKGLSQEFTERHEAFLASGCSTPPDVCPKSKEELDLANVLVIRAINAGIASTFLPFACRK